MSGSALQDLKLLLPLDLLSLEEVSIASNYRLLFFELSTPFGCGKLPPFLPRLPPSPDLTVKLGTGGRVRLDPIWAASTPIHSTGERRPWGSIQRLGQKGRGAYRVLPFACRTPHHTPFLPSPTALKIIPLAPS